VLIAIISIKGFFLTFGKLSDAPPVFFPSNFFCPNNLTEWPLNKEQNKCINKSYKFYNKQVFETKNKRWNNLA